MPSGHFPRISGRASSMAWVRGSQAAMAVRRQDYTGALVATAAGAAGVLLIERLLRDSAKAVQERKDV